MPSMSRLNSVTSTNVVRCFCPMKKIYQTLGVAALVAVLFSSALGAVIVRTAWQSIEGEVAAQSGLTRVLLLNEIVTTLQEAESNQRAFVASGNLVFLDNQDSQRISLQRMLSQLWETRSAEGEADPRMVELEQSVFEQLTYMDEVIRLRREEGSEAARALVDSLRGKRLMDDTREIADSFGSEQVQSLRVRQERAEVRAKISISLVIIGSMLNAALILGTIMFIRRELKDRDSLLSRLGQESEEISVLSKLGNDLQGCDTHGEAAEVLHHHFQKGFSGLNGALYIMADSRNILKLSAQWSCEDSEHSFMNAIQPDDCWALKLGRTHIMHADGQSMACKHHYRNDGSSICLPLVAQGSIVGLLYLQPSRGQDLRKIQNKAELLANQVGPAIGGISLKEALRRENVRDPLTNLYNRRHMTAFLERELLRSNREHTPVSVVMLDVDHFKTFNDTQGHQAGDVVLRELGHFLKSNIRGEDIACRYGGEEFLLVLPGANIEQARQRAEFIRQSISTMLVVYGVNHLPSITCSFGIATYRNKGDDSQMLIKRADKALYKAKNNGRNCVMIADIEIEENSRPKVIANKKC